MSELEAESELKSTENGLGALKLSGLFTQLRT